MTSRSQVACAWIGFAGIAVLFVGMLIAGYIPAPAAYLSAEELAAHYRGHEFSVRLGVLFIIIGCVGWLTVVAASWVQLRRVTGRGSALPAVHALAGVAAYTFLSLFGVLLAAAAFRPERNPEITQMLHDIGWFMAFLAAPPFVTQALASGAAILGDRSTAPAYPRWLGWAGVWVGLALIPGDILLFFQHGPFAYHGIISYWIPLFAFGGWWILLAVGVLGAAKSAEAEKSTEHAEA
jgi:uncharacterized membrane protein YidH (DUF202 family)